VTYTPTDAASATHNITAAFGGSTIHNISNNTASPFALTVNKRNTTTSVSCGSPVIAGQASTCTASVTDTSGTGASAPTGTSTVLAGVATTCTATVTDTHPAGTASAPSGTVTFSTSSTGSFSGSPCTLTSATSRSSTCSVSYTPTNAASATHTITGNYGGSIT